MTLCISTFQRVSQLFAQGGVGSICIADSQREGDHGTRGLVLGDAGDVACCCYCRRLVVDVGNCDSDRCCGGVCSIVDPESNLLSSSLSSSTQLHAFAMPSIRRSI